MQAFVSSIDRSPTNRALPFVPGPLSVSDVHVVATLPASGDEVPESLPQVTTTPVSALPASASPDTSALEADIKDLKVQLLRAKFVDLFQVKNKLVRCMQKLEDAEDDNKKLRKAHEMSNISWHVIQTVFPQVTSLLHSGMDKVLDLYDTRARQAQLEPSPSFMTGMCGEQSESVRLGTRPDERASATAHDGRTPLSDDADEDLVSRIQGALLGTPSSSSVPVPATEHACSPTPNQLRQPSNERKSPRILPGTTKLPSYLTSCLITDSQTPDILDAAPAELAATESGHSRLTPFSHINTQHSAVTGSPNLPKTSISDLIAHINSLPDKIIDSLPHQCVPMTTTGKTILDSTGNSPAHSPTQSPEKTRHPPGTLETSQMVCTCGHLSTNENDPVAHENPSNTIKTEADALRAELWHVREENRKLERRVRVLLNQQNGCGF